MTAGIHPRAHLDASPTTVERESPMRGWINVFVAAMMMVATLPGRTQGLGLITEPLMRDLRLDRVVYANINLWATLLGALVCLPFGWVFDRFGLRLTTAAIVISLGATAWGMHVQSG